MLTVLLATRNGERTLPAVLESHCRLASPAGGWKFVIVDNGSTDQTRDVVATFTERLPLTYLYEPSSGKNAALNTGIAAISGDLVVFTDDDTWPRPDWLLRMRTLADSRPEFAIFGGAVVPRWEVPPPDWILSWVPLGPAYTISDPSLVEGPITVGQIFGPNMAVRAHIFRAGYRFDPSMGPRGPRYPMGGETELVKRLSEAGFRAWYCPHAVVEHFVCREHLDRPWILARAMRFGRGQHRLGAGHQPIGTRMWLGVPRWYVRAFLESVLAMGRARLAGDPENAFRARWQFNYWLGGILEARRQHKEERRTTGPPAGTTG
jgi:glycosyltransferase involved in cell wall biosynthesis